MWFLPLLGSLLSMVSFAPGAAAEPQSNHSPTTSTENASPRSPHAELPLNFERHTGDLDSMVKRGSIRALVLYSRTGFFYVNGQPEGIYYQALQYFEQFVNREAAYQASMCRLRSFPSAPTSSGGPEPRGGRSDCVRTRRNSRPRAASRLLDPDTNRM